MGARSAHLDINWDIKMNTKRYIPYLPIILVEILITTFLTKITDHFTKISQDSKKIARRPIIENVRRLPNTLEKEPKMFRSYTKQITVYGSHMILVK